jgi:hypothetical protein
MRFAMLRPLLIAATLALTSLPASAQQCNTVRFPSGAYAHAVQGYANQYSSQCWSLDVRPGQQARVRITYGSVFFTTTHTQGQFQDVQFRTINGRLYVYVHTDFGGQQPYSIEFAFI